MKQTFTYFLCHLIAELTFANGSTIVTTLCPVVRIRTEF